MRNMKAFLIAGLLAAAPSAAGAQDVPASDPAPEAPASVPAEAAPAEAAPAAPPAQGAPTLSEAGAALYKDYKIRQRVELVPLYKRNSELQAEFDALMKPENYDDSKLQKTMAEMQQVGAEIVGKQASSLQALLRAFSDEDRAIFFKSMSKTPPPVSSRTPAAPTDGPGR